MEDTVIVGRHAVRGAIITGYPINKMLIQEDVKKQQIDEILKSAKDQKIIVQTVPRSKLGFLANTPHQGVTAFIMPYEYADSNQFLEQRKEKEGLLAVFILDGLEDPHNLGSILRTVDATGVDDVVIPKRRSVTLTQTVAKASTGTVGHVPVIQVTNLAKTIDELRDNGFWVAGTEANNAADYRNLKADVSLAIVIGNEGQSMSRLVSDKCDFYIKIPMAGHIGSLNTSVVANLMMYEILRRRRDVGEI